MRIRHLKFQPYFSKLLGLRFIHERVPWGHLAHSNYFKNQIQPKLVLGEGGGLGGGGGGEGEGNICSLANYSLLLCGLFYEGDLFYVLPCVILFLCFSVLVALRLPHLGRGELVLLLFRTFV